MPSRIIPRSDDAIQKMIGERKDMVRSLKDEVFRVVKILEEPEDSEENGVKITFDKDGRCKVLERRINEAFKAASKA